MNLNVKKTTTRNLSILLMILTPLFAITTCAFAETSDSTNIKNSTNTIIDIKPFQSPNILLAFGIALLIVGVTTKITSYIVQQARLASLTPEQRKNSNLYHGSFWDIIREGDYSPSLARFQFLLWTAAVSFAVLSVFFIRLFGGVPSFPSGDLIPPNLLQMIGISTATPVVSNVVSRIKYASSFPMVMPPKTKVPKFPTMLLEGNKPTLARYQMFLWTWISIIFFLVVFFSSVADVTKQINTANHDPMLKSNPLRNLSIQDIDSKLVVLMGLSQGGYVAAKFAARQPIQITSLVLSNGNLISVFGDNFGTDQGIVKIGTTILPKEQVEWDDTRINLKSTTPFTEQNTITIITSDGYSQTQTYDKDIIE